MTPLSPDEALYAFMDSELEISEEQRLFDELASSSDLRTEMKDILSIRNAVHRDVAVPSPTVESSLLTMAGLNTAAPIAATGSAWAPWMYGGIGAVVGIALMAALMWSPLSGPSITNNAVTTSTGMNGVAGRGGSGNEGNGNTASNSILSAPMPIVIHDTVRVRVPVRVPDNASNIASAQQLENKAPIPLSNTNSTELTPDQNVKTLGITEAPSYANANDHNLGNGSQLGLGLERQAPWISSMSGNTTNPVQVRIKTLASGLDNSMPTPESVRSAILPNSSLAFLLPVGERHRLGVEMGTESFHQNFIGMVGKRQVMYDQTPVLFWMGSSYEWNPISLDVLPGLEPFLTLTGAYAFSQGPLVRGSVGLSYKPTGPISFNVGMDAANLWYQNESTWYTSSKWGFTYGISIDLGSIR